MKKIRILFLPLIIIALFVLNSCSSSNEPIDGFVEEDTNTTTLTDPANPTNPANPANPSTPGSSTVLLKKIINTYPDGEKATVNFTYNGNKLVSIIDDSGEINVYVTYTGDLITKLEYKQPNGTVEQIDTFTYGTNGKLASFVKSEPIDKLGNKEVYTYNSDGSISVVEYIGDDKIQTQSNSTSTIKFVNGEVSEITSSNSLENHKYTYDAKNNPLKNVLGWGKISFYGGEADGILVNIISDTNSSQSYTYTYTYNSSNYPVTSKEIDDTGYIVKAEYFY